MAYFMPSRAGGGVDHQMTEGATDFDYQIANKQVRAVRKDFGIPYAFTT